MKFQKGQSSKARVGDGKNHFLQPYGASGLSACRAASCWRAAPPFLTPAVSPRLRPHCIGHRTGVRASCILLAVSKLCLKEEE